MLRQQALHGCGTGQPAVHIGLAEGNAAAVITGRLHADQVNETGALGSILQESEGEVDIVPGHLFAIAPNSGGRPGEIQNLAVLGDFKGGEEEGLQIAVLILINPVGAAEVHVVDPAENIGLTVQIECRVRGSGANHQVFHVLLGGFSGGLRFSGSCGLRTSGRRSLGCGLLTASGKQPQQQHSRQEQAKRSFHISVFSFFCGRRPHFSIRYSQGPKKGAPRLRQNAPLHTTTYPIGVSSVPHRNDRHYHRQVSWLWFIAFRPLLSIANGFLTEHSPSQ